MFKDAKDPKHRFDSFRQPQRKDSLSSILSWAALHGKITASKTSSPLSSSASQSQSPQTQTSSGNGTSKRRRRHSHSAITEAKAKARRGSATLRQFSLSNSATSQVGASSTKTRHAKISCMAPDPEASPGTPKTGSDHDESSEKVNEAASPITGGKDTTRTQSRPAQGPQDKPR
jgi:hypothetical protein